MSIHTLTNIDHYPLHTDMHRQTHKCTQTHILSGGIHTVSSLKMNVFTYSTYTLQKKQAIVMGGKEDSKARNRQDNIIALNMLIVDRQKPHIISWSTVM